MTEWQAQFVFNEMMDLQPTEAHHGLCVGADEQFDAMLAYSIGCVVHGHPPINRSKMADITCDVMHEAKEYLPRNRDIVDATTWLMAAPKGPEEQRSGTWSTVRYARRLGRSITIVMPDATIIRENQR